MKLHDKCPNPKGNCQKITTFTPHQFMLEGGSIKSKPQKTFGRTQFARNKIPKTANNATAPIIGLAVSGKSKDSRVGQATSNFLKSLTGGKVLSLTDMQGNGLSLKVT